MSTELTLLTERENASDRLFADIPTVFINLDKREDRRHHVEEELRKLGMTTVQRFPAIRHARGAWGCAMSHIRALEIAISHNWDSVFICEDDIEFENPTLLCGQFKLFVENTPQWDVAIIGGHLNPPFSNLTDHSCRIFNCQTTTGYVVKKHYMKILHSNFVQGLRSFMKWPSRKLQFAIDIYWKHLQTTDKWFVILPMTVTQYVNFSDIEDSVVNYGRMMIKKITPAVVSAGGSERQRVTVVEDGRNERQRVTVVSAGGSEPRQPKKFLM
jgi:hypothetical protein